eukprot:COSAG05_NODE_5129_length_1257_cov_4.224525_1_plen_217_part_01
MDAQTISFSAADYTLPRVVLPPAVAAAGRRPSFVLPHVAKAPPLPPPKRPRRRPKVAFGGNSPAPYFSTASSRGSSPGGARSSSTHFAGGQISVVRRTERVSEPFQNHSLTKYIQVELLGGLLKSGAFRTLVLIVITLNSILVGLQTSVQLERKHAALFLTLDYIFLTFFAVEILLKWVANFASFWRSSWNVFDFLIVTISLAGQGLSFMSSGRVLR